MRKLSVWILAAVMLIAIVPRAQAYQVPYEKWFGTYFGASKIGYYSFKIDNADFDGMKGYRISSVLNAKMAMMGSGVQLLVSTVIFTNDKYEPVKEDFYWSSGGRTTRVQAKFTPATVECVVSAGSGVSNKIVTIPDGVKLVSDSMYSFDGKTPAVGESATSFYFNPLSLDIERIVVKIDRREKITSEGKSFDALVVTNSSKMGDTTIWQDDAGDIIKLIGPMNIGMVDMPREKAMSAEGGPAANDIAFATSIKPDKPIDNPRKVKHLDIIFKGIKPDSDLVLTDMRQRTFAVDDDKTATRYVVDAKPFRESDSLTLPMKLDDMKEFVKPTAYLDYDTKAVKRQADEIAGSEKNAYKVCAKFRDWVYSNMTARTDVGIIRSASDVLNSKYGVCRDYAILMGAFARSQGIPAKVVSGIIYTQGAFYYHAWVECYVGEWVPFDATLGSDFVDAAHIKMAQGDATTMFNLSKVIGTLKAEVLSYK